MFNLNLIANILGFLSLMSAAVAFSPCIISTVKKRLKHQRSLLKIARIGLIITVGLALVHGLLTTQLESIDFYNLHTYWVYAVGLFSFNLIVFLTFTFTELKADNKKLNYFSYGALLLLIFHVGQQIIPAF